MSCLSFFSLLKFKIKDYSLAFGIYNFLGSPIEESSIKKGEEMHFGETN